MASHKSKSDVNRSKVRPGHETHQISKTKSDFDRSRVSPSNETHKISIFYNGTHHVTTQNASNGLMKLPRSTNLDSIAVFHQKETDAIPIPIPFRVRPMAELESNHDTHLSDVTVHKVGYVEMSGTLIDLTDKYVTLLTEDGKNTRVQESDQISKRFIRVYKPDRIIATTATTDEYYMPSITFDTGVRGTVHVTYSSDLVSWTPYVILNLIEDFVHRDKDQVVGVLSLMASIQSSTKCTGDFVLVPERLLARNIYASARYDLKESEDEYGPRNVSKYFKQRSYPITDEIELDRKHVKPLESVNVQLTSLFVGQVGQDGPVKYGYQFVAPFYIPKCGVTVYTVKDKVLGHPLGSTVTEQTNQGSLSRVIMGDTDRVSCTYTRKVGRTYDRTYVGVDMHEKFSFEAVVSNLQSIDAYLIFEYYGKSIKSVLSGDGVIAGNTLRFEFIAKPGDSKFECSFVKSS